jgi:hypothetical protein
MNISCPVTENPADTWSLATSKPGDVFRRHKTALYYRVRRHKEDGRVESQYYEWGGGTIRMPVDEIKDAYLVGRESDSDTDLNGHPVICMISEIRAYVEAL